MMFAAHFRQLSCKVQQRQCVLQFVPPCKDNKGLEARAVHEATQRI